jgi:hypothetical protein
MSPNGPYTGPPWSSGGGSEEPYAEPSDPWGDQVAGVPEPPVWHPPSIPHQPASYQPPMGGSGAMWAPPPPPKRNAPMLVLVVTLGLLICVGLGATLYLLNERNNKPVDTGAQPTSAAAADPGPAPIGSEDARFNVKEGDCVVNEGSDDEPAMRTTSCTSGTYEVLKRVKGRTSGEKDAEDKCAKVRGYTKWYFYDSPLDDLDFVLCLKEHKAL